MLLDSVFLQDGSPDAVTPSPQRDPCAPDSSKGTGLQLHDVVHSPPHCGGKPQGLQLISLCCAIQAEADLLC